MWRLLHESTRLVDEAGSGLLSLLISKWVYSKRVILRLLELAIGSTLEGLWGSVELR